MLSKTLKTAAGKLFDPLAKGLGKFGVKPNHITISGVALTMYAALLLYDQNIYYAFLVGMIASLFDGADGLVARATKTSSVRGGYLDATLDRYADCIAFSALILCDWVNPLPIESLEFISGQMWAMAAMIGAFQTSYCRAAAERLGVSQEGIGLIERPERWFIRNGIVDRRIDGGCGDYRYHRSCFTGNFRKSNGYTKNESFLG